MSGRRQAIDAIWRGWKPADDLDHLFRRARVGCRTECGAQAMKRAEEAESRAIDLLLDPYRNKEAAADH